MSGHTSGPWWLCTWSIHAESPGEPASICSGDEDEPDDICHFPRTPVLADGQNMANAQLIAAAPEMLAAIDTAIIVIAGTCVRTEGERQNLQIAHDQLSAARKKARGDA